MRIWLDADSLPRELRAFVVRRAASYSIKVALVANREIDAGQNGDAGNIARRKKLLINKFDETSTAKNAGNAHGSSQENAPHGNAPRKKLLINKNGGASEADGPTKSGNGHGGSRENAPHGNAPCKKLLINKFDEASAAKNAGNARGGSQENAPHGNAPRKKLLINKNGGASEADGPNKSGNGCGDSAGKSANCEMVVCDKSPEAADDYIAANAKAFDMVITRDIPLAARLAKNGICVLNDRGASYTKESAEKKLRDRNYNLMLAEIGFGGRGKKSYGKKEFDDFAHCFERELMRLVRDETHASPNQSSSLA